MKLPSRMRAALLKGHGGFEQLEVREDVPVPAPGAGDVLVAIGAAAVNNTDINLRTGWYSKQADAAAADERAADAGWTGSALRFPRIQGADACGTIVAVGAATDAGRIGERVIIDPVLRPPGGGLDGTRYFGSDCDGAFAAYAVVPAANARTVRSALSDVELATFPCSYTAAENMVSRAAVAGDNVVLVTGASGGVGSAALQLARRRGARVIAVAVASKAAAVAGLGASRVIARDADLRAELGPESVDVIIDVAGGAAFRSYPDLLRRGGRYAVAGAIAGALVELDLRSLYLKDLTLLGCTVPSRAAFCDLIDYIERGEIRPLVSAVYPLADIARAQHDFLSKNHVGKIVLVP